MSAERPPSLYSSGRFDWCVHGSCPACPEVGRNAYGEKRCTCPCHNTEDAA